MAKSLKLSPELQNEAAVLALFTKKFYAQQRYQHWWQYVQIANRKLRQATEKKMISDQTARYLYQKLIPQAYRAFQNIISQGAFISLGFTLIAMFSRIYYLLKELMPSLTSSQRRQIPPKPSNKAPKQKKSHAPPLLFIEDADLGEPIEDLPSEPTPLPLGETTLLSHSQKHQSLKPADKKEKGKLNGDQKEAKLKENGKVKTKSKSKSKSRSKRDAIDDIFGF